MLLSVAFPEVVRVPVQHAHHLAHVKPFLPQVKVPQEGPRLDQAAASTTLLGFLHPGTMSKVDFYSSENTSNRQRLTHEVGSIGRGHLSLPHYPRIY